MKAHSQFNVESSSSSSEAPAILGSVEKKLPKTMNLALTPIENDLLNMNIKYGGEDEYNIHELPQIDGKRLLKRMYYELNQVSSRA